MINKKDKRNYKLVEKNVGSKSTDVVPKNIFYYF